MDKYFKISERGSTLRVEILGGLTTFMTMAYILIVNPLTISQGNSQIFNGVFFATCIASFVGTILMGVYANAPLAQAPGMGLNATFTFAILPAMVVLSGNPNLDQVTAYQMGLSVILLSGVLFIIITVFGLREMVVEAIPNSIKAAISGGIGLMLAMVGFKGSGLFVADPAIIINMTSFQDFANPAVLSGLLCLLGLLIMTVLYAKRVKGSILISIVTVTILGYATGVSVIPDSFSFNLGAQAADFVNVSLFKVNFSAFTQGGFLTALSTMLVLIISFSLSDMFDTIGTVLAVSKEGNLTDKDGNVPFMKRALLSDAIATTVGAVTGTSTVTTFIESAAGIGEGAKTGFSSVIVAALFLAAIPLAPFMILVPGYATAPALIFVGALMLKQLKGVEFEDITIAVPALLTVFLMPITSSIATGIAFGLISFVLIKLFVGRYKEIKPLTAILAALFVLKFVVGI
ncbi:MAG: NCS2 family permease [Oscillospiraceae bacterium]